MFNTVVLPRLWALSTRPALRNTLQLVPTRHLSRSIPSLADATQTQASSPTSSTEPTKSLGPSEPSSCPAGTVFKGLNVFKDGKDPVAKADNEYPDWLWTILEPKKTEFEEHEKLSREYFRFLNKQKILNNALAKKSRRIVAKQRAPSVVIRKKAKRNRSP